LVRWHVHSNGRRNMDHLSRCEGMAAAERRKTDVWEGLVRAYSRGSLQPTLFRSFSSGRLLRPTWSSTLKIFQEESFCSKPVFHGSAAGLLGQPHFVKNFIFLLAVDRRTRRGRLRFSLFPGHHLPPLSY